jgi:hypothetical protein
LISGFLELTSQNHIIMKPALLRLSVFFFLLFTACTGKEKPVIVKFEGASTEKKWAIKDLNSELPADWSSFGFLTFEMYSTTTQRFDLLLLDAEGTRRLVIQPFQGARVRASIPLIHFQKRNTQGMDMAAIGKTARPGYWIGFTGAVGPINKVDSLGVVMKLPIGSPTIEFNNFRLTIAAEDTIFGPTPLVDEFGQWIPADWPGKAKTEDELKTAWIAEEKTLKSGDFNVSKYGGFLGTRAKATGFFRVEKIDGKWWFVDPEGYLFFSTGSCGIGSGSAFSRVQGREYIFTAMPPADLLTIPNRPSGGVRNTSFYTWNLYRRFGSDWYKKWMDLTVSRMDSWGINTIGNWSDATLGGSQRKAYVATLRGWGIETGIMGMPDVYAPDYISKVDSAAALQCATRKDDPYLLGYFLGNELPWPGRESELVNTILAGKETPMKAALKTYLSGGDTPERRRAFVYESFSRFLSIVNSAVKKHDPNHLNLGLRYGGSPPDDIIKASMGFDVFSLNIYGYDTNAKLKRVYDLTGLPIIIGEFHFGTPGRGLAPGLAQTRNQEERGVAYSYYVENAAAHPALIGTHWFQWMDQPPTGRNDGENYNIGFLDVTDRPYTELVDAAKLTFKRLQDVHSGKVPPVGRQAIVH